MISVKVEKIFMGGIGSGDWYTFNKKTTVEECRSLDVRRLHREGLLKPGRLFSWSWSRAGREVASIGALVEGHDGPERVVLLFRRRSGPSAEWEDVREPVELAWTLCNFGGERPWFICPGERAAAGGLRSFTDRGATSCAAAAMTLPTRASGITRCTALCTEHRTSAGALEEART
jgi:hypothetical protein